MSSPAPTLKINIDDKPHEVTMYFGRLNELAELVGSVERVPEISFDVRVRTLTLTICLAPRDDRGRYSDMDWQIPPALSIADGEAVLDWASEHVMDFFLGRLEKHLATIQTSGDRLTVVGSFLNGLAPSASKIQ